MMVLLIRSKDISNYNTSTMKFLIKYCFVLVVLLSMAPSGNNAFGQQDEQLSLYNYNPLYYNPAYAGSKSALSVVALARFQWVNFEGAPNTQFLSVHTPVM